MARVGGMRLLPTLVAAGLTLSLLAPPAAAQRLLDWPVRTGAGPEALGSGAGAVFWNPAGSAWLERRGEALVLDIRGPALAEVGGLAAAVAVETVEPVVFAFGFHHLGLAGIERTTDSPDSRGQTLDVGEDVFRAATAWAVHDRLGIGLVLEHWRSNPGGSGSRIGAGATLRVGGPWGPAVGFAAYAGPGSPRWIAGAEVRRNVRLGRAADVVAAYGMTQDARLSVPGHRGTIAAEWDGRLRIAAGISAEPSGTMIHVDPIVEARLRIGSFTLSVLREQLASGFGAAHYLGIGGVF